MRLLENSNILSWNIPESNGKLLSILKFPLQCQKNVVEELRNFEMILE